MISNVWQIPVGLLFTIPLLTGCGDQQFESTYRVTGTVTLDQTPLPQNIVFLTPETGDLQSIAIENGVYSGEVRAGQRRVEIRAYRPETGPRTPMDPPPSNYLPERYNTTTELSATISATDPNVFDFALNSK